MNALLEANNPDDILFTASFTMTLKQWKKFKEQLSYDWPSSDFTRAVHSMISQAERTYYPEVMEK